MVKTKKLFVRVFVYPDFLTRTPMIDRTAGEGEGYFFGYSLPL